MSLMRRKGWIVLLAGIAALMVPAGGLYASCGSAPIIHGLTGPTSFTNCGPNPVAFVWAHKRGVQRIIGNAGTSGDTVAGHDSGNKFGVNDGVLLAGSIPGQYFGQTDFANTEWDGCVANPELAEPTGGATSVCTGATDVPPLDFAIGGIDPAAPNVARIAALSVDFNEFFGGHVLDQAGAAAGDGDPCNGDAFQAIQRNVDCLPVPAPTINSTGACDATGCTITIGAGDVGPVVSQSILDDCLVAEDKATNCPRNLYQGRVLMFKHGACTASTAAAFDRRAWVYPASPTSGTLTVASNFFPYSVEDANLNGVLDAGEDGTNGGAVNGTLDPFVIAGTTATTTPVKVPAVPGASDCIFFGLGILLDPGGGSVNPPTNTIFGEKVVSPAVSLNVNPVRAGSGTPVTDVVTNINVSKSQGKGTVSWSTGIETTTAGFNVIGAKKGGNELKLNASLISAKEGTTGKGASYTMTFDGAQLKGSTSIYLEIVKTDGSKERFGPASF